MIEESQGIVDVILPVFNNLNFTRICINSILENTKIPYNLIIVNNGSTDGTYEYLEDLASGVLFEPRHIGKFNITIIHNKENLGWCKALNQGIRASNGEYVCFLNNDTLVTPRWLEKMIEKFSDEVAAVGPVSNAVLGRQHIQYNNPRTIVEEAQFLIGFCLLVKRQVLDILYVMDGWYIDERFGIGGSEEIDLAIRVRKLGYKMLIVRDVYIHHFFSQTLTKVVAGDMSEFYERQHAILVKKWGEETVKQYFGSVPKILIGIPSLGSISNKFLLSLVHTNMPFQVSYEVITRSMPDVARNALVDIALAYGFDMIFLTDDDMVWDDENLLIKLVQSNVDIVGVQAHTRLPPYFPCVFKSNGFFYDPIDIKGQGLTEVDAIGASCLLVKTEVFRKLPRPWFKFEEIKILGLEKERWGEDVYFCRLAKQHGFKIYCHGDLVIWHIGERMLVGRETWQQYNEERAKEYQALTKIKLAGE